MKRIYFFTIFFIAFIPLLISKAQEGDITPPRIFDVTVGEPTDNSVSISWKTDEETNSKINYGLSADYDLSASDNTFSTTHSVELTELDPSTHYHFHIIAIDGNQNRTESDDYSFDTIDLAGAPDFSGNISITQATPDSALVEFTTTASANVFIAYGQTESYSEYFEDADFATDHSYLIHDLIPNITYHFRITIRNQVGTSISEDMTLFLNEDGNSDITPPDRITDLSSINTSGTYSTLTWTRPPDESGVAYYEIRFSNSEITENNLDSAEIVTGELILVDSIEESNGKDTYQIVGLSENTNYFFVIRAIDSYRNFSSISNITSINTTSSSSPSSGGHTSSGSCPDPSIQKVPFGPVTDVKAGALDKEIHLFWKNPKATDFYKVLIVRKEKNFPIDQKDGTIIYEGNSETFVDTKVINEMTYFYKIFTFDKSLKMSIPVQFSISPRGGIHRLHFITAGHGAISIKLTKDFKKGSRDHEITHVQELLALDPEIYPEGLTTGYFGPLTERALKKFQEKNGLSVSGEIDLPTREKLMELSKIQNITSSPFEIGVMPFSKDLNFGMKNNDVRYLQEFLIKEGLFPENMVSGFFGPITQKALGLFQEKCGLTQTNGILGPTTRAKILEILTK